MNNPFISSGKSSMPTRSIELVGTMPDTAAKNLNSAHGGDHLLAGHPPATKISGVRHGNAAKRPASPSGSLQAGPSPKKSRITRSSSFETPPSPSPTTLQWNPGLGVLRSLTNHSSSGQVSIVSSSSCDHPGKENVDPRIGNKDVNNIDSGSGSEKELTSESSNASLVDLTEDKLDELSQQDYSVSQFLLCDCDSHHNSCAEARQTCPNERQASSRCPLHVHF